MAIWIEALLLAPRIENPEVRLGVAAGGRCPLPIPVVYTRIVINQFLGEVPFAPAPIDMQILSKERSSNHAKPIMHETSLVELSHPGIDYWKARPSFPPELEGLFIPFPGYAIILSFEWFSEYVGEVEGQCA